RHRDADRGDPGTHGAGAGGPCARQFARSAGRTHARIPAQRRTAQRRPCGQVRRFRQELRENQNPRPFGSARDGRRKHLMDLGVLHCIPSIEPAYGGPVVVARGLCRELSARGARVSVLAASSGSAEKDRKNASAFGRADFVWTKPLVRRVYCGAFLQRKNEALFGRSAIVHVPGVFNGLSSSACASARRAGIPYVLTPFGTLSPYCLKKNAFLKRAALLAGERANIEGAAAMQFSSASEASRVRAAFKIKENIEAPNGIEWGDFEGPPAPGPFPKSRKCDAAEKAWV